MKTALLQRKLICYLRRLGLPGIAGLVLIAGAVVYLSAVLLPANAYHDNLERQINEASIKLRSGENETIGRALTPTEKLIAFYEAFPKETTIPDWLGKIYAIAEEQKLDLEVGEYSLTETKSSRLNQFRIIFPIKGNYLQIRKFIGSALATAPALALDSVYLKRDKVDTGTVDGRIVFLLYLEKGE